MIPVGTSASGQRRGVRRCPYIIISIDVPTTPIPDDAMYMEALVFALVPHPPQKVLADYCAQTELCPERFNCSPVVFAKDQREGKGTLRIRRDGNQFHGRINWRP